MRKRYFVTYRASEGSNVAPVIEMIGRFGSLEAAEEFALGHSFGREVEVERVREETPFEIGVYRARRLAIRTLRIVAGALLGLIAYSYLSTHGLEFSDTPLGTITPRMIGQAIFSVAVAVGAVWACTELAFGSGPNDY